MKRLPDVPHYWPAKFVFLWKLSFLAFKCSFHYCNCSFSSRKTLSVAAGYGRVYLWSVSNLQLKKLIFFKETPAMKIYFLVSRFSHTLLHIPIKYAISKIWFNCISLTIYSNNFFRVHSCFSITYPTNWSCLYLYIHWMNNGRKVTMTMRHIFKLLKYCGLDRTVIWITTYLNLKLIYMKPFKVARKHYSFIPSAVFRAELFRSFYRKTIWMRYPWVEWIQYYYYW